VGAGVCGEGAEFREESSGKESAYQGACVTSREDAAEIEETGFNKERRFEGRGGREKTSDCGGGLVAVGERN